MFSNPWKKSSPSKSAPATSQSTQQQPQPDHLWSVLRPTFRSKGFPPSTSPSPFSRHSHILSTTAAGELLFFGGRAHGSLRNDLYVVSTRDYSVTFLKTTGEVPSPRFLSAGVLVNNVLLIFGGATEVDNDGYPTGNDDSLYLLSLASREWTRVVVNGLGPVGRCGHAMTMVGSKLFVFGGVADRGHLNDVWAFDLNSLNSNPVWNLYEPAPGDEKPPPRNNHVLVATGDRIILFSGTGNGKRYNDTWTFDVSTRKWTELECTGCVPSPRGSHAAALVDDVMYVFGGRDVDRRLMGGLIGLKLSTRQWLMFQKGGPSPSERSGHAMASSGTRVFMFGGRLATGALADESALIHVLETKPIKNSKPHPITVETSEKTTQPPLKSSVGPSTQEQQQHFTSSSSDAYVAHGTSSQKPISEELGRPATPQITRERNPSPNGLPSQPTGVNGKTRRVPENDESRVVELERQLSATLAAQTERDQRLAQLTEELALKSALLEQAEGNAAEATKRAGLEPRELADWLLPQTLVVEHKDAELVKLQAKLDELVLSRDQALQTATSRAAVADERSRRASEQIRQYETELEAVRLRLTDAEIGWAKSKAEADTLRALTSAGLVSADEDRMTRGLLERIRAMEDEMASQRWSEKSFEAMETRNEG
ncbi:hypothetical protein DFH94DRAFT_373498 [Russula ochroleuca]|uniref:Galactose oxidase n=1 Tax=Russula ochroleuca TaxID=152965 RepID=A0A9P5MZS8_9AGAM|nr:hypothetical protein DFH94DRAFT_373498 [Russula ochroleuca]